MKRAQPVVSIYLDVVSRPTNRLCNTTNVTGDTTDVRMQFIPAGSAVIRRRPFVQNTMWLVKTYVG